MISLVDSQTKPKGLNNVGATCYMNSTLQCFYHVKELTNEILKLGNLNPQTMPMTYAFFCVCADLASKNYNNSVNPEIFKQVININPLFRGIQANDSKDLILYILETMETELTIAGFSPMKYFYLLNKKLNPNLDPQLQSAIVNFMQTHCSIISDLFYGFKFQMIECLTCHNKSKNYELYNFFIFPIEQVYLNKNRQNNNSYAKTDNYGRSRQTTNSSYGNFYNGYNSRTQIGSKKEVTLEECFNYEKKDYKFEGENEIFCNKCHQMRIGNQTNKILYTPYVMIIILNRGKANKFDCDVKFGNKFDTSKFVENEYSPSSYDLIGVISHYGESGMGGHFIAECKHFDGRWYSFSDASVSGPKSNYSQGGIPYILFYRSDSLK